MSLSRPSATLIRIFCFCPPDRRLKGWRLTRSKSRPRRWDIAFIRLGSLPQTPAAKRISWPTGIFSGGGSCGTKPTRASTSSR